jgi:Polysaccharide lyase
LEYIALPGNKEDQTMKKFTVWDIFTFLALLSAAGLFVVFAQIFTNPQVAFNPLPPPTMIPTLGIPTSTPTLKSLPSTWTPPPVGSYVAQQSTRATLRPSQTWPPSATAMVLSTFTITPTDMPTTAPLPNTTETPTTIPQASSTALKTNTPLPTNTTSPGNAATPTKTLLPGMLTSTPLPTNTVKAPLPTVQASSMPISTSTPTTEPTTETPPDNAAIVWKATHEDGDIREWQEHGDFITQGSSAYYNMITSPVHGGNYAVSLTIDTEGFSNSNSYAAYLFYWDQLPEDAYYYSAWYYIPSGTQPQDWWNVWQWKSTYNGSTDYSVPMHVLDIRERSTGQLSLQLIYRPDLTDKINYSQTIKFVPTDQWFQIEAYYKKGYNHNGQVIIWQDGTEIFNLSGVQTTESDNTIYWSVNHYTDNIVPNLCSIYIDDAAISTKRLGPDYVLP